MNHTISARDSIDSTYFYDTGNLESPDPFNIRITGNIAQRELVTLGESHVFSPSIINSFKVVYSRVVSIAPTTLAAITASAGDTSLGFAPNLPVGLINIGGVSNFQGGLKATGEFDFHLNSYQLYDDVYYTHGNHTIKAGFAFERLQNLPHHPNPHPQPRRPVRARHRPHRDRQPPRAADEPDRQPHRRSHRQPHR